jgi:hypothetical protein
MESPRRTEEREDAALRMPSAPQRGKEVQVRARRRCGGRRALSVRRPARGIGIALRCDAIVGAGAHVQGDVAAAAALRCMRYAAPVAMRAACPARRDLLGLRPVLHMT